LSELKANYNQDEDGISLALSTKEGQSYFCFVILLFS